VSINYTLIEANALTTAPCHMCRPTWSNCSNSAPL